MVEAQLLSGRHRLSAYVRKRTADSFHADDVVQETLVRTLRRHRQGALTNPMAYAFRVADSVMIGHYRNEKRSGALGDGLSILIAPCSYEDELDRRSRLALVERALAGMSPIRREVFLRRHMDGEARSEIAATMGLSVEAVKKHLVRAMTEIQMYLASGSVQ